MPTRRLAVLAATTFTLAAAAAQTTGSAAAATHSPGEAVRLVKTIYAPYEHGRSTVTLGNCFLGSPHGCATSSARHVPAALQAKLRKRATTHEDDPVICAQNTPSHLSYGAPRVHGSIATIVVHTFYTGTPRTDHQIAIGVDLRNLKLTQLTCRKPVARKAAPRPARVALTTNPTGGRQVRPRAIALGIDGTLRLERLVWKHWGSHAATATGVIKIRNCDPDCATSNHTFVYRVEVSARRIIACRDGHRQYTSIAYAVTDHAGFARDLPALKQANADRDGNGARSYGC